jgi:hypothetical protein
MSFMTPRTINPKEKVGKRKWQKRYYLFKTAGVYCIYYDTAEDTLLFCRGLTVILDVTHLESMDLELRSEHQPAIRLTREQWRDAVVRRDYMDRGYKITVIDDMGRVRMTT